MHISILHHYQSQYFGFVLNTQPGFELQYTGPDDDPYRAMLGRDAISIMLKSIVPGRTAIPKHTRHDWVAWDAYISVANPDKLVAEYNSGNVPFSKPLNDRSDSVRGFEIADDYILFFGCSNLP